jgi:hypothetical protein
MACLVTTGCGFLDTLEECADLSSTVNPTLESVKLDAGAGNKPEDLRTIAGIYGALGEQLQSKPYTSRRLKPLVRQYAKLAAAIADNADAYADALERRQVRIQKRAAKTSAQNAGRQKALNRRIELVCAGR